MRIMKKIFGQGCYKKYSFKCQKNFKKNTQEEITSVQDGENSKTSFAQNRPVDVHKAGERRENQSDRYEKEEKVRVRVIIMNKKKKRNLRSKDRRAPTRVVAASTPPFRWQGH